MLHAGKQVGNWLRDASALLSAKCVRWAYCFWLSTLWQEFGNVGDESYNNFNAVITMPSVLIQVFGMLMA